MRSSLEAEAAASNGSIATPPSKKRKAADSKAGSAHSSRLQTTTPCRITRSRFKTMNENSSAPSSLNPGLEMQPRRRRALQRGQQATAVANQPHEAVSGAPTALEEIENGSTPHSQTDKKFSEADVAAASQLARAVLKAGLTAEVSTGSADTSEILHVNDSITEKGPVNITAQVVNDGEVTQYCTPPTDPRDPPPLPSTLSPSIHGVGGERDDYHCGTDIDMSRPGSVVGSSPEQARPEADENEAEAADEWPGAEEAAGADTVAEAGSQGDTKTQRPTPWLPDKADNFRPQWEWSASERAQSQTTAPVADEHKPTAISTPSLIRSGGISGEVERPVRDQNTGDSDSTLTWQPEANETMYAADVAQVVSPGHNQAVTGPLPPVVLQWEPAPYFVADDGYSPEISPADFEGSEPEGFELEEWDDDVDP